jgi:exodeoxyribonuclease V alpha subunit
MSLMRETLILEGFRPLDLELAALLGRLEPEAPPAVALAGALASAWRLAGHACLSLAEVAGRELGRAAGPWGERAPALEAWRADLRASRLVSRGGAMEEAAPLVLDGDDGLYLQRLHAAEGRVAEAVLARLRPCPPPPGLEGLLAELAGALDEGQRGAVRAAFHRGVSILTGGPGTGKTSTLGRLLAMALAGEPELRIRLAAPTGKAAARMQEALAATAAHLPERARDALGGLPRAGTLHRLLHERPALDWLVIDEASMVDLPLMAQVAELLPPAARLLLVGDADQLASVEAGAVLHHLVAGLAARSAAVDDGAPPPVTRLTVSRRFRDEGGIGALAAAVRNTDGERVEDVLAAGDGELEWIRPDRPGWSRRLQDLLEEGTRPFREAPDAAAALAALDQFRVVCARRTGRLGVEGVNAWCERRWTAPGQAARSPILVRANDAVLGLANGDSGVREGLPGDAAARCLLAPEGVPRELAAAQLPPFDPAWAITVHQAQGSEADNLLFILPEAPSPLLCRELLYTGLTRARRRLTVVASAEALRLAVARRQERGSGLAVRLTFLTGQEGGGA